MERQVLKGVRKQVLDKLYKHEFDVAANLLASLFVLPAPKKSIDFQAGKVVAHTYYNDESYKLMQFYVDSGNMNYASATKRSILYETALCAITNSKFAEAAKFIQFTPFKANKSMIPPNSSLYQGMLGIIYYLQWEEKQGVELYEISIKYLSKAMELDASCHIFVLYYCKLLLVNQEIDKIITILTDFRSKNGNNPLAHRMLGWIILKFQSLDPASEKFKIMIECFKNEFEVDPCSELAFQVLVNVYFNHLGHVSDQEIVVIVFYHLDFIINYNERDQTEEEPCQWEILWSVLQKVELKSVTEFVKSNLRWIPHHFVTFGHFQGEFKSQCKNYFKENKLL